MKHNRKLINNPTYYSQLVFDKDPRTPMGISISLKMNYGLSCSGVTQWYNTCLSNKPDATAKTNKKTNSNNKKY
jgi:hypothetical protein